MKFTILILATLSSIAFASSFAHAGPGEGGGGDVQCDARIKEITANLRDWFLGAGPEKNSLLDLSSTVNPKTNRPYTKREYTKAMETLIAMPLRSACVHRSRPNVGAVAIGHTPKICRTTIKAGVVEMLCDADVFLNMSGDSLLNQDLQIQQIHHEFAINVPGLEPDSASLPILRPSTIDISSYLISRQLARVTQTTEVRKVMVMDPAQTSVTNTQNCTLSIQYYSYKNASWDRDAILESIFSAAGWSVVPNDGDIQVTISPTALESGKSSAHIAYDVWGKKVKVSDTEKLISSYAFSAQRKDTVGIFEKDYQVTNNRGRDAIETAVADFTAFMAQHQNFCVRK